MIQVGDTLPATTLMEFNAVETEGCPIGPAAVSTAGAVDQRYGHDLRQAVGPPHGVQSRRAIENLDLTGAWKESDGPIPRE